MGWECFAAASCHQARYGTALHCGSATVLALPQSMPVTENSTHLSAGLGSSGTSGSSGGEGGGAGAGGSAGTTIASGGGGAGGGG